MLRPSRRGSFYLQSISKIDPFRYSKVMSERGFYCLVEILTYLCTSCCFFPVCVCASLFSTAMTNSTCLTSAAVSLLHFACHMTNNVLFPAGFFFFLSSHSVSVRTVTRANLEKIVRNMAATKCLMGLFLNVSFIYLFTFFF